MVGMSGGKYPHFINNLIRGLPNPSYLEVGCWTGSTLCSAISRNRVRATGIDNWSEFGGPKDQFLANVNRFKVPEAHVTFVECVSQAGHREPWHLQCLSLRRPARLSGSL